MLVVRSVSPPVVPYFMDGRAGGAWTPGAGRLLGLSGPVRPSDLRAVLGGRHPRSGRFLPTVKGSRRRSGWDLVFAAPKSVSLLAADPAVGDGVASAHTEAVAQIVDYLERRLTVVRSAEPGGTAPAEGLIGACFGHRANAAAEPHLHSHVLIANLTHTDRGWSAVRNEGWFTGRRSLAALYQLALRAEMRRLGWQLDWRLRPDGLADVAEVPSAAVRATSTQSRLTLAHGRYDARRQAAPGPWREEARRAGWETAPAGAAPGVGGVPPVAWIQEHSGGSPAAPTQEHSPDDARLDDPDLAVRVTSRLAARRSDFSVPDAIVALGASHAPGAPAEVAAAWAERFCAGNLPVRSPTAGRRWTTALAKSADDRLVTALDRLRRDGSAGGTGARLADGTAPPAGGIVMLSAPAGRSALLAQAEMLERWHRSWSAGGARVSLDCPTTLGAARWAVLTGLAPHRRGDRVDILVIDQADRRSTPELLSLTADARRAATAVVLVEGGTLPRVSNFASHGLAEFAESALRLACPPETPWARADAALPARRLEPGLTGRGAATGLLDLWAADPHAALLVGLGLEEVKALNLGARYRVGGTGSPAESSGAIDAARAAPTRRFSGFRTGDRVVVIRSRPGLPPYGTFGEVTDSYRPGARLSVRWAGEDRVRSHDGQALAGLGHGWAVTAHMAVRLGRPVMILGAADAVPRLRGLVRAEVEPPARGRPLLLER